MIVTIDGPAGTGKSSVAMAIADRLGFDFLDTGAMYRAIALEALRRNANLQDVRELTFVAKHCRINFDWSKRPPGVRLNDEPVGHLLRSGDVTRAASSIAVAPAIREQLVAEQQRIGREHGNLVTEGRDQGTVVFPQAPFKFYLNATAAERARRRVAQLRARGEIHDFHEILHQIVARDHRDATRAVGPMAIPDGAVVIDTTSITQEQVVNMIVKTVEGSIAK
ncbi:MAG TPA: (d)CMP kinase [Tepidisphaeraceae bacterium]|jgi:cytidylate kinase|nr:(d)CMP kinase [Tepidisphaeraceae bacterium]